MAWTDTARVKHKREGRTLSKRFDGWGMGADRAAVCLRRDAGGRPRTTDLRAVIDAILYIGVERLRRGACCPSDFPPLSTVRGYFYAWRDSGPAGDDQPPAGDEQRANRLAAKPARRPA